MNNKQDCYMNKSMTIGTSVLCLSLSASLTMAENVPPPQGPYTSIAAMKILPEQSSSYEGKYLTSDNRSNKVDKRQIESDEPKQHYENRTRPLWQEQNYAARSGIRNTQQNTQPNVYINPAYPVRRGPVYGPTSLPPANYARPAYPAYPVNRRNTYPPAWR